MVSKLTRAEAFAADHYVSGPYADDPPAKATCSVTSSDQFSPGISGALGYQPVIPTLTVAQQFRLIEIAHDTQHEAVRRSALELLNRAMNPVRTYEPGFQIRDGTAFPGEPLA